MDAYAINIALNLRANVGGSTTIIRELGLVESSALKVKGILGTLGIGLGIAEGIKEMASATSDYAHQLSLLQSVIRDNKQMADAVNAAWATSFSTPTSDATENLKAINDLIPAFGNVPDATANIDSLQKLSAVITNLGGGPDQVFDIAKALETRGAAQDSERFKRESSMMVQASEATGGRVSARDYLQFIRQENPFATGFSNEFLYRVAPTLIQDMGASRSGTALNTLENTLAGGRMTKAAKAEMTQLGLLDAGVSYKEGSAGTVQVDQKGLKGANLALDNPYKWVNEVMIPALVAHGITGAKEQEKEIAKLFSNRNAERIVVEFSVNQSRYAKDAGVIAQTEDPYAVYDRQKDTDPKMLGIEIWAQLKDVLIGIGRDALPIVLPLMRDFRDALVELNKALNGIDNVYSEALKGIFASPRDALVTFGILDKKDASPFEQGGIKDWLVRHGIVGSTQATSIAPPPLRQDITLNSTVVLPNGDVLGKAVTKYQAGQMNSNANSPSFFDPRRGYSPPGFAY